MKKVIIIGATSGIGRELAIYYIKQGDIVGITGRRKEKLRELKESHVKNVFFREMDIRENNCVSQLEELINEMGGMDVFIANSGVGCQSEDLVSEIEMNTISTNVIGFSQMIIYAYNYFKNQKSGHIVGISSIAGIKALCQDPAYSASKRFQMMYLSCLAQKAHKEKLPIKFTTIKPGFIKTDMVQKNYPLTISLKKGGRLIFNAIEKEKRSEIVPARWIGVVALWKLIPNRVWERISI